MPKELSWTEAIEEILNQGGIALHYKDIADLIIKNNLRKKIGANPVSRVYSYIRKSLKEEGAKSPFIEVGRGMYMSSKRTRTGNVEIKDTDDETEAQYDIITSFGVFWRRSLINWVSIPRILGMQEIGATPVDFSSQIGIYLLYDGREIIYVGRCTERTLGKRLFEHTKDRLATRWDRFSWFGLLPVSDEGALGSLPKQYSGDKVIPALEAILIEALEPRQNRKRGDDLQAAEYIQKEDPAINIKNKMDIIESLKEQIQQRNL